MSRQVIAYPCSKCRRPFELNPAQVARLRKNPKASVYCSAACAGTLRTLAHCDSCSKQFHPNPFQRKSLREGKVVYCSIDCYWNKRRATDKASVVNS